MGDNSDDEKKDSKGVDLDKKEGEQTKSSDGINDPTKKGKGKEEEQKGTGDHQRLFDPETDEQVPNPTPDAPVLFPTGMSRLYATSQILSKSGKRRKPRLPELSEGLGSGSDQQEESTWTSLLSVENRANIGTFEGKAYDGSFASSKKRFGYESGIEGYVLHSAMGIASLKVGTRIINTYDMGDALTFGPSKQYLGKYEKLDIPDTEELNEDQLAGILPFISPGNDIASFIGYSLSIADEIVIMSFCHSVKQLRSLNVGSRLKQKKVDFDPQIILEMVKFCSSSGNMNSISDSVLSMRREDSWIKYHSTVVSTPALVAKVLDDLIKLQLVNRAYIGLVKEAVEHSYSPEVIDRIPQSLISYTAAFLMAAGRYPESWYQGNRAQDDCPPAKWKLLLTVAKKYYALLGQTAHVSDSDSINTLIVAIGTSGLPTIQ